MKLAWGLALAVLLAGWLGQGDGIGGDVGGQVEEAAEAAEAEPAPAVRRIAVTFDDLPATATLRPGAEGQAEILTAVREAVLAHEIPAIGFVNEGKLYREGAERPDPRRVALLEEWLDAGLALGNHTFSHPDLHDTPLDRWLADAERGEAVTRRLLAARGGELTWFRHPFLHTGRDLETKRQVQEFLAARGMRVAPVTVDNDDYLFASAWNRAAKSGDTSLQQRIEEAYVPYMTAKVAYYEDQARSLFGREIPLVLLVHANSINARRFDALAAALEARGYRFVPLAEALDDPAYDSVDAYTGPAGISWIHRWALSREVDRELFRGEPDVPGWLAEAAGGG